MLSDVVEPLLERATELKREGFVRQKEVQKRLADYRKEGAKAVSQMLRVHVSGDKAEEMWETVAEICMNLERITTFSFTTREQCRAGKKPVKQPFDQVCMAANAPCGRHPLPD